MKIDLYLGYAFIVIASILPCFIGIGMCYSFFRDRSYSKNTSKRKKLKDFSRIIQTSQNNQSQEKIHKKEQEK